MALMLKMKGGPIGAWKFNLLPFKEIMTDRPSNQRTWQLSQGNKVISFIFPVWDFSMVKLSFEIVE